MEQPLNCILLIEDCEADIYLHRKIIDDLEAARQVLAIPSGDDALAYLRANQESGAPQPDLIFLDINTPGMEGWDFIEVFDRFDDQTKSQCAIVMLSGSLNPDDQARAESMPLIKEFRPKPLTRRALREILATHFHL